MSDILSCINRHASNNIALALGAERKMMMLKNGFWRKWPSYFPLAIDLVPGTSRDDGARLQRPSGCIFPRPHLPQRTKDP